MFRRLNVILGKIKDRNLNLPKMKAESKSAAFTKFAWFVLAYNVAVILWGAFLRASKSGDGCGQHWLTCGGEVVPTAPQFKTVIEFSHRLSTGLAFLLVAALCIWAFRKFQKGNIVRKMAFASFIFIVIEALLGAGLVLTGNTAENWTPTRPFWMTGHLLTTFSLLAALTLTAWFARGEKAFNLKAPVYIQALLGFSVIGILLVGMSGTVAALSNMLFPSTSLTESVAQDFSEASHILLRLRISHPIISILTGAFLIFTAYSLRTKFKENFQTIRFANILIALVAAQLAFGSLTLLMHAPLLMQIGHLLLADAVWIIFVLMAATVLAESNYGKSKEVLTASEYLH